MKKFKLFLTLLALLGFGQTAWAQNEWPKVWTSGNTTYTLTADSVFTVSAISNTDGAMANYSHPDYRPWNDEKTLVNTIIVNPGVTVIGAYCFQDFTNVTSVTLPVGLREIHTCGFSFCESLTSINIPHTVTFIESLAFGFCRNLLSVYSYPHPDNLTWNISDDDFGYGTNPSTTQIHVYNTHLSAYQSKFNNVQNIEFVGDITTSGNWTDAGNFSGSFHEDTSISTIYIDSEADLARIAYCVNTHVTEYLNWTFKLTRDLDMTAHYWTAIGTRDNPFKGNFEGDGHTISGITFNPSNTSDYAGLFGYVEGEFAPSSQTIIEGCGFIQNLIMTRANVKGGEFVGGVIGRCYGESAFINIICQANVTGTKSVGGLIGQAQGYNIYCKTTIKNCLLTGGVITGNENCAALIGTIADNTEREKNFYINPESNTNNSFDVRAYPVTKSDIPENVTVTINTDPGLTYQGIFYAPVGTVNFTVKNSNPTNHIARVKVNGSELGTTVGNNTENNYSFNIVSETEAYVITVTIEDQPFIFTTNGYWNEVSNWSLGVLPTSNDNITLNATATIPSGFVAQAGTINMGASGNLILNDGAQLIHGNGGVTATVKKEITGVGDNWSSASDGWYFIASPMMADNGIVPNNVSNLVGSDYDLYRLNGTKWENAKAHPDDFVLNNGVGYLYANKTTVALEFTGELRPYSETNPANQVQVNAGWNLIGNPFVCNVCADRTFYKMNETRTGLSAELPVTTVIAPCEGIIVNATEAGMLTFNRPGESSVAPSNGNLQINLSQVSTERGAAIIQDKAIVSFAEGLVLPKFRFGDNAEIYIPQGDEDYAIVSVGGRDAARHVSTDEIPVNFKAKENGEYTLTFNLENVEMDYLHLIDNLTGADVDLLAAKGGDARHCVSTYTFTAKTTDYESRFRLVFSADEDVCEPGFAFISNGNIIVNGEGTLQIVDVMGRVVVSCGGHTRCVPTNGMTAGVYILRLIDGNKVKTQKLVIH